MDNLNACVRHKWVTLSSLWINIIIIIRCVHGSAWDRWWSYEGINGPVYWGRTNPDWRRCLDGRQQSPINIEPSMLLYDPGLKNLRIDTVMVGGLLLNTGHDITLELKSEGFNFINISEGPLAYTYRLSEIKFHLSNNDSLGSEHTVSGRSFPAEMQVIGYNSDLYRNVTEASTNVKGLAIISAMIEIGKDIHKAFYFISKHLRWLRYKGNMMQVSAVYLHNILPRTEEYVTYEGSLTRPGCQETVTWLLLNKPLTISRSQLSDLRVLFNERQSSHNLVLETNSRPVMPLNQRALRTNIGSHRTTKLCSMEIEKNYQVNTRYTYK